MSFGERLDSNQLRQIISSWLYGTRDQNIPPDRIQFRLQSSMNDMECEPYVVIKEDGKKP